MFPALETLSLSNIYLENAEKGIAHTFNFRELSTLTLCHCSGSEGFLTEVDFFADPEVATFNCEGAPGIKITYLQLAEFLEEAERLQGVKQPALGEESIGKKSSRRIKKSKRPPTPTDQISSDREREFGDAEREVEQRKVVEDSIFKVQFGDISTYRKGK